MSKEIFDQVTKSVRVLSAAAVEKAKSGHPGMPLGMAEVGTVLFKDYLKEMSKIASYEWKEKELNRLFISI